MRKVFAVIELLIEDDVNNITDWLLEEVGNNLNEGESITDYHIAYLDESSSKILDTLTNKE